ncbi:cytochrome P450 [Streptomyces sp. CA-243310]|uniref:cytochrome P450 n=1 Tax=Streptomyces sp. CA-243310 TaxID=3240056 RepID=UPI003D8F3B9E
MAAKGIADTGAPVPPPLLPGGALLGSLRELRADALGTFVRARREAGDIVRIGAGPPGLRTELYCVFSAEGVRQVLASRSAEFRKDNVFYQEVREAFGNGLLTSQDEDYLRQRRLIQPLFTRQRVNGYADAVAAETRSLSAAWADAPDGIVDVGAEMRRLALRTVARVLFGADVDAAVEVVDRCFPVITEYVLRRGFSAVAVPRTWPTAANRRANAAMDDLHAVCDRIVAGRRHGGPHGRDPDGVAAGDLLTLLASARNADDGTFDAGELRAQVLIFLLAGHETTATSLAFALHLLALHPDVQARAREEVSRVLGDRTPQAADLDRLPYLTRVLKETTRLYPAAPVFGRRARAATVVGGHLIPAGAEVILAPWVTHRHPAYWPDPDRFDPDRFTERAQAGRPRHAWFPFGAGPRACVGQHFSMLESVLAAAMVLREYAFEAVDEVVPVSAGITLRTRGPVRCRIRRVAG